MSTTIPRYGTSGSRQSRSPSGRMHRISGLLRQSRIKSRRKVKFVVSSSDEQEATDRGMDTFSLSEVVNANQMNEKSEGEQEKCPQNDAGLDKIGILPHEKSYFSRAAEFVREKAAIYCQNSSLGKENSCLTSGTMTPGARAPIDVEYVPRPKEYKPTVLAWIYGGQAAAVTKDRCRSIGHSNLFDPALLEEKLKLYKDASTDPRQTSDFFAGEHNPTVERDPDSEQDPARISSTKPTSPSLVALSRTPHARASMGPSSPKKLKRPVWHEVSDDSQSQSWVSTGSMMIEEQVAPGSPNFRSVVQSGASSRKSMSTIRKAKAFARDPVGHLRRSRSKSRACQLRQQKCVELNITERISAEDYLVRMSQALMRVGAPTHRLEEYMIMAARRLRIRASFQYWSSCMYVSFDDLTMRTTRLKVIAELPDVDLSKLEDVYEVYKNVMHEKYSIHEALDDLASIMTRRKRRGVWTLIPLYGLAAASIGPIAFGARPIDSPISFTLGCVLGILQLRVVPTSPQFSPLFEMLTACITSFLARAFGSIIYHDSLHTRIFCFSALAQSSVALILPGWLILSSALELQSRNIISGSIRMVYAMIYTLFLQLGSFAGILLFGLVNKGNGPTNDSMCPPATGLLVLNHPWRLLYMKFVWVPVFTVCMALICQAKFRQLPAMIIISAAGYSVNYWCIQSFSDNVQVANVLGAFAIGILANVHSRFRHTIPAAAAMLPAIFLMVPSGLVASTFIVDGLAAAYPITHSSHRDHQWSRVIIHNDTRTFMTVSAQVGNVTSYLYDGTVGKSIFGMVQVAVGISAGLFLSALTVYPFTSKKLSALFTL